MPTVPAAQGQAGGDAGFLLSACTAQNDLDAGQQLARIEGFGDVIIRAGLQADNFVNIIVMAADQDDANEVIAGAQLARQFQTVFAGQADIEQQHGNILAGQHLPHLLAVVGQKNDITLGREIGLQAFAGDGVVVDHQKFDRAIFHRLGS